MSAYKSNVYIDPAMNIIVPCTHVLDLGVSISSNFTFGFHISNLGAFILEHVSEINGRHLQ